MSYGKQSPFKLFGSRRRKREQREAKRALDQQMQAYRNFNVSENIYEDAAQAYSDAENVYAGAENVFEGMENPFEDMRIDTTGAELAGAQFAQSQADQLAALGGAAGTSGLGALTTSMGRQAQQAAAANTADVRRQAQQRSQMIAQGASNIQQMERQGAADQQRMILSGADQQRQLQLQGAMLDAQGRQGILDRELAKQQEFLAMAAGRKQAADQARQQNTQMWMGLAGDVIGGVMSYAGAAKQSLNPTGQK